MDKHAGDTIILSLIILFFFDSSSVISVYPPGPDFARVPPNICE